MAPAHAILVWADAHSIYCAPQASPDAEISFRLSTGGLAQALALLSKAAPPEPFVRQQIVPRKLKDEGLSLEDYAKARRVLKEVGII